MRRLKPDIPSTVTIHRHPLHPMMVVFPIAFLFAALPADVVFLLTADPFWARASFWLLAGGVAAGLAAGAVGTVDLLSMREARTTVSAWSHMASALMLLALAGYNLRIRWNEPVEAVLPWGLVLSAAGALMVVVAAWQGGTLTFRHGFGNYSEPGDGDGR